LSVADVKLDSLGFAFVRFYIKPNNTLEMRHLPYKVDTGANRTTISKNMLLAVISHSLCYVQNRNH